MKKALIACFILVSCVLFPKTPTEHYQEAEAYSEKSKNSLILAGAALVFVIAVKYINRKSGK